MLNHYHDNATPMSRDEVSASVLSVYNNFLRINWESKIEYALWLSQTYYYTSQAPRILAYALAKTDQKSSYLYKILSQEIREEEGHENLCDQDLLSLGFDITQFPEFPETSFFYQTLYYLIDHLGPASLLGYLFPLEGMGSLHTVHLYNRAKNQFGDRAAGFLRVHSTLDIQHFEHCVETLQKVSEPSHWNAIRVGSQQCEAVLKHMVSAILHHAKVQGDIYGIKKSGPPLQPHSDGVLESSQF